VAAPVAAPAERVKRGGGTSFAVYWLYLAWGNMMFDGHFFLAAMVSPQLGRLGTLINVPIMIIGIMQLPSVLGTKRSWTLAWPMAILLAVGVINAPFAENFTMAKDAIKVLLLFWLMMIATAALIKTP
jgi:hypothetical protein